ncbi:hypothetical protein D9Q98_002326 [Chlorella vulgaris]|uniref:Uncharacterized protein n=1 Tax=Chlorella vulgaris TaxID=3077 RepID=A0A9D4Z0U2_CHLVU|nr:hypothetical protein D9Q98_002326 [Chlorella vulgaris]
MAAHIGGGSGRFVTGLLLLLTVAWVSQAQSEVTAFNSLTSLSSSGYDSSSRLGTFCKGQTIVSGPVEGLRLTSLTLALSATVAPITLTLALYRIPAGQTAMSPDAVPDFTNGPTSFTLPSFGSGVALTTFDTRTNGQGFLLAPLTRYGIILVPYGGSFFNPVIIVASASTTLGMSDLGFAYGIVPVPPAPYGNYGNLFGRPGQGWASPGSSDLPMAMMLTVTQPRPSRPPPKPRLPPPPTFQAPSEAAMVGSLFWVGFNHRGGAWNRLAGQPGQSRILYGDGNGIKLMATFAAGGYQNKQAFIRTLTLTQGVVTTSTKLVQQGSRWVLRVVAKGQPVTGPQRVEIGRGITVRATRFEGGLPTGVIVTTPHLRVRVAQRALNPANVVPNKPYGEWLDVYVALLAPPPLPTGGLFSGKN